MTESRPRRRVEIQIHPSDIQRGVKYLFLSRLQIGLAIAGVALFLGFLGLGLYLAPDVVAGWLRRQEHQSLQLARAELVERVTALHGRLDRLNDRSEQLQLQMNKVYLAYGLANDSSIGQGGYPEVSTLDGQIASLGPDLQADIVPAATSEVRLREQIHVLEAFLTEIQSFEEAHLDQVTSTPSTSPLRGGDFRLTSPFGQRRSPFTKKLDFHAGIDLASLSGTPIYAPADGKVSFAGRYPLRNSVAWWRYGNMVSIRHGDRFITLYGHMDEIRVKTGQQIEQGDVIGTVGNTGWSTNPHLHFEVRRMDEEGKFRPVDPRIYMLDHSWSDEDELLVRARRAPIDDFEPLPGLIMR